MKVLVVCDGEYKVFSMNNEGVVWFNKSQGHRFRPQDSHPVLWNKGWYYFFPRYMAAFGEPQNNSETPQKPSEITGSFDKSQFNRSK